MLSDDSAGSWFARSRLAGCRRLRPGVSGVDSRLCRCDGRRCTPTAPVRVVSSPLATAATPSEHGQQQADSLWRSRLMS